MRTILSLILFTTFTIASTSKSHALACSSSQWEKCNDDINCLAKESGSCGDYISRLKSCPACQSHDNETDTFTCFKQKGC